MIPLCCSQYSGKKAMALGARYDEVNKIFFIDNRHNRDNFYKWLPRFYRPSKKNDSVIKVYSCPYDSPARNMKELMGNADFFKLKSKINEFNGGICQYCGEKSNLWLVPIWKSHFNKDIDTLHQELISIIGACPNCARLALGLSNDASLLEKMNNWSKERAISHIDSVKKKNNRKYTNYDVGIEKAKNIIRR